MSDSILNFFSCKVQPAIYIVATPIGNLSDMTFRGVGILKSVDVIACEDKRISAKLLSAFSISTKTIAYHDHSKQEMRDKIFTMVRAGQSVALISDAGTPLVSDPGFKLVRDAIDCGIDVIPIPGANAPMTAMMAGGLPTDIFTFIGFLPHKKQARENIIRDFTPNMGTIIMFDSPKRIIDTIEITVKINPDMHVVVGRELTKKFEQFIRGTAGDIQSKIEKMEKKGEVVIMMHMPDIDTRDVDIDGLLRQALLTMRLKDASTLVAEKTGKSKREIYDRALQLRADDGG